jgi:hypothetical protein
MGFITGALVKALPEPSGGIVFTLCDENIRRYSQLYANVNENGGKLIQAYYASVGQRETPALTISGQVLTDAGFSFGDILIARYEYGIIRLQKLPDNIKITHMKSIKDNRTGNTISKLRLFGEWLKEFGFMPDMPINAGIENGTITFRLADACIEKYSELVRFARENKMKLLEVKTVPARGKLFPYIMLTGTFLDKSGFKEGDALIAFCEHGYIKLQKLDFTDTGF